MAAAKLWSEFTSLLCFSSPLMAVAYNGKRDPRFAFHVAVQLSTLNLPRVAMTHRLAFAWYPVLPFQFCLFVCLFFFFFENSYRSLSGLPKVFARACCVRTDCHALKSNMSTDCRFRRYKHVFSAFVTQNSSLALMLYSHFYC